MTRLPFVALFVFGCAAAPAELDAATTDANACPVELEYACGSRPHVCCHGAWLWFSDGLCGRSIDGGPPDGGFWDASLACEVEGASECIDGVRAECRANQWEATDVLCSFPGCG